MNIRDIVVCKLCGEVFMPGQTCPGCHVPKTAIPLKAYLEHFYKKDNT